jgi:hypothetical protein
MSRHVLTIFLILSSQIAQCQFQELSIEIVYSTFSMNSIKSLQKQIKDQSNFPFKIVNDFPAYFGYNFNVDYHFKERWSIGPRIQYISTGGRLYYGDYSGFVRQDQLFRGYGLAITAKYRSNNSSEWPFYWTFSGGGLYSDLRMKGEASVGTSSVKDETDFYSVNYIFQPGFQVNRKLNNSFKVFISIGYELQIHGKLKISNGYLQDYYQNKVTAEWDGLRIGAGLSFRIPDKAEDDY